MSNLLKFFLFIIIIIFSISIFAQTGTLKIFSEIDSINVYLDDVYHGNGKSPIESIPVGSHYLKLLKNDIIIFSELVNISDNVVTSILLKDTPGIRKKLLEGLSAEIKSYNAEKITLNIEMVNNQPSSWFLIQNNNIITQKNQKKIEITSKGRGRNRGPQQKLVPLAIHSFCQLAAFPSSMRPAVTKASPISHPPFAVAPRIKARENSISLS